MQEADDTVVNLPFRRSIKELEQTILAEQFAAEGEGTIILFHKPDSK